MDNLLRQRHADAMSLCPFFIPASIEQGEKILFVFVRHAGSIVRHADISFDSFSFYVIYPVTTGKSKSPFHLLHFYIFLGQKEIEHDRKEEHDCYAILGKYGAYNLWKNPEHFRGLCETKSNVLAE